MVIDWTLDLGTIITMIGLVGGGLVLITMMRANLLSLGSRMEAVESSMKRLTDVLMTVAEQRARIDAFDQRMDRLEHQMDTHLAAPA